MHVVIGGYGRVGRLLARRLEEGGHTVAVIDSNHLVFEDDESDVAGTRLLGQVFDRRLLEEAGIERADAFAAVTSGDNSNIVSSRIAKDHYKVPRVVARIYDPDRADIYRDLGIETVASVTLTSSRLYDLITGPGLRTSHAYGNGNVVMIETTASDALAGKLLKSIEVPGEVDVAVVVRQGEPMLPTPEFVIEQGDVLCIDVTRGSVDSLADSLGLEG